MPALPVPDTGRVTRLAVRNTARSRSPTSRVEGEELGVEVAEDGPGQAGRRLRVGVRRAGTEQQAAPGTSRGRPVRAGSG